MIVIKENVRFSRISVGGADVFSLIRLTLRRCWRRSLGRVEACLGLSWRPWLRNAWAFLAAFSGWKLGNSSLTQFFRFCFLNAKHE